RGDSEVQAVLGAPARLFDDETQGPAYPYAVLERHEYLDAGAAMSCAQEHLIRIATYSRHDGHYEAKSILGALRAGVERLSLSLPGQNLVLAHVTYCDAMRTRDRRLFRGVFQFRLVIEEA
ncbi:MAG: DUF3168 domain-containing protein, partial [Pseudomonadota bacterium]